jgi:glutaminyl-tRNA synthetase
MKDHLNPDSLQVLPSCPAEPVLNSFAPGTRVQFERLGYFCADEVDSKPDKPVYNRTITLRDPWARIERAETQKGAQKRKR